MGQINRGQGSGGDKEIKISEGERSMWRVRQRDKERACV